MKRYINDKGQFWDGRAVTIGDTTYISPSEEVLAMAGYHEYVPTYTAEELLAMAKERKIAEIEAVDASMESFTIGGQDMWLGHELRQQLKTSVEAYIANGEQAVTKWFGGKKFTFPCQSWLQMLAVLEVYAAEVLNVTEAHKAAVMALDTIEAIEAYDIMTGYPEKVDFN